MRQTKKDPVDSTHYSNLFIASCFKQCFILVALYMVFWKWKTRGIFWLCIPKLMNMLEMYLFQVQQNTWPVKNVTKLQVSTAEYVVLGHSISSKYFITGVILTNQLSCLWPCIVTESKQTALSYLDKLLHFIRKLKFCDMSHGVGLG